MTNEKLVVMKNKKKEVLACFVCWDLCQLETLVYTNFCAKVVKAYIKISLLLLTT